MDQDPLHRPLVRASGSHPAPAIRGHLTRYHSLVRVKAFYEFFYIFLVLSDYWLKVGITLIDDRRALRIQALEGVDKLGIAIVDDWRPLGLTMLYKTAVFAADCIKLGLVAGENAMKGISQPLSDFLGGCTYPLTDVLIMIASDLLD
jgi:hypothetical protein